MFPIKVCELTKKESEIFEKYFCNEEGCFYFEGMWLRNQRKENAKQSGYKDETTQRRRYIHFYDRYVLLKEEDKNYLAVKDTYVCVTNTLKIDEVKEYKTKILNALEEKGYEKKNNVYVKGNFNVIINEYANHYKNAEAGVTFPSDYSSIDVICVTDGYEYSSHYDRMWKHSTKMFRIPEKRENPTYINSINEIEKFFPAQVEMGCGPSIEASIPPLYNMHETYRVQNHISKTFYFASDDDLILNIILDPQKMYEKFGYVPKCCVKAEHTEAYKTFNELYKKGVFRGIVYNNNFDRLVTRFDIKEYILRIYDKDKYLPKAEFDPFVKSLVCIGTHADRRQMQKQAREYGLKIIYIDPEGFYEDGEFIPYPIEGPKTGDVILKKTFTEAMQMFKEKFLD